MAFCTKNPPLHIRIYGDIIHIIKRREGIVTDGEYFFSVRLRVGSEGGDAGTVFGSGTAQLLRGVRELGSLNRAAAAMGMAYSKAWTGVKKTEANLGFELIDRNRRGSSLTARGERFLEAYESAVRDAEAAAKAAFGRAELS